MKPFRVSAPSGNTNAKTETTAPVPGKAIVHSRDTGDRLPDGSKDTVDHDAVIPWGPVDNGSKPFKLK